MTFSVKGMSKEPKSRLLFRSGLLFGEKNPSYVDISRFEGNVTIVKHPTDEEDFGDGSLEVNGTLFTDTIKSATA